MEVWSGLIILFHHKEQLLQNSSSLWWRRGGGEWLNKLFSDSSDLSRESQDIFTYTEFLHFVLYLGGRSVNRILHPSIMSTKTARKTRAWVVRHSRKRNPQLTVNLDRYRNLVTSFTISV